MLFNTFLYFIFLFAFLAIYYILPKTSIKKVFILLASYGFYAYWDVRFCGLLFGLSIITYALAKGLESRSSAKMITGLGIVVNLAVLLAFKYFNFFIDTFELLPGVNIDLGFTEKNLIFPVGLSFYTLQSISYLVDVKNNKVKPASLLDVFNLLAFFPKIIAGPLVKTGNFLSQLSSNMHPTRQQVESGAYLIVVGLFRKVLIADPSGKIVDNIFKQPEYFLAPEILCASILFVIQIYADFSAYTFIARGSAKLMGIDMMRNFKFPLFSRNLIDYWHRWHISLAEWFRDYLYLPLNNGKKSFSIYALFITAAVGGLWHGADWNFLLWGLYNAVVIFITSRILKNHLSNGIEIRMKDIPSIILTWFITLFGWFIYRLDQMSDLPVIADKFLHWESSDVGYTMLQITVVFLITIFILELFEHLYQVKKTGFMRNKYVRIGAVLAIFVMTLIYMFQTEPSPFIYFQF